MVAASKFIPMELAALPIIILENIFHRKQHQILIKFKYDDTLIKQLRTVSGTR